MFYLLYKHQWNTKPWNFSSLVENIFHSFATLTREVFFNNSKRNFVFSRGHVIYYISFFLLPCSIKKILPSGQGFHNKHFKIPLKKFIFRFRKCLAHRSLKEASDSNSTMFCGRLFHKILYNFIDKNLIKDSGLMESKEALERQCKTDKIKKGSCF